MYEHENDVKIGREEKKKTKNKPKTHTKRVGQK